MSPEENKAILQRAADHWNKGDLSGYLELYDPNAVVYGYQGVEPGVESIKQFYSAFWVAFPGCQLTFEDLIAEGNRVAVRFVVHGIHQGDFQGIPATGKQVTVPGITILRFVGGKCVERWSQADFLGLLQQLGVVPTPRQAPT